MRHASGFGPGRDDVVGPEEEALVVTQQNMLLDRLNLSYSLGQPDSKNGA